MERIPSSDINRRLKEVLEKVEAGEQIMLTRYGKDVALMVNPLAPEAIHESVTSTREDIPTLHGSPPKSAQTARDELLSRIRSR